jgi:hypothetical protein
VPTAFSGSFLRHLNQMSAMPQHVDSSVRDLPRPLDRSLESPHHQQVVGQTIRDANDLRQNGAIVHLTGQIHALPPGAKAFAQCVLMQMTFSCLGREIQLSWHVWFAIDNSERCLASSRSYHPGVHSTPTACCDCAHKFSEGCLRRTTQRSLNSRKPNTRHIRTESREP